MAITADSVEKVADHSFMIGFVELHSCFLENLDFNPLQRRCKKLNSRI